MRITSVAPAMALLLLGGIVGWVLHARGNGESEADEHELEPAAMAAKVTLGKATGGPIDVTLHALGCARVLPASQLQLTASQSSRITGVAIAPGARVAKGSVLVNFDPAPATAAVAAATAALATARAELGAFQNGGAATRERELRAAVETATAAADIARRRATQLRELRGDGLAAERTIAEVEAETARLDRERTQAEAQASLWQTTGREIESQRLTAAVASAEEQAATAARGAADVELRAPADAVVAEVFVGVGDQPAIGAPLARLLLDGARAIDLAVAPAELARVRTGAAVVVSDGTDERKARVTTIAPTVDAATGLARVRAVLDDDQAPPLDGAAVQAEIAVEHLDAAVLVPASALVRSGDELVVVKVDDAKIAHNVTVAVIARRSGVCAVRGELAVGDTIVVDGAVNLPDGAHVVAADETAGEHR